MDIIPSTRLVCPFCKAILTAEQFDSYTYGNSLSREQRRKFKTIEEVKNRKTKKKDYFYKCTECNHFSRATKILTEEVYLRNNSKKQVAEPEAPDIHEKPLLDFDNLE